MTHPCKHRPGKRHYQLVFRFTGLELVEVAWCQKCGAFGERVGERWVWTLPEDARSEVTP